jgi:hypothetical protein
MRFVALSMALTMMWPTTQARAEAACMKRDVLVKQLVEKYHEKPAGQGIVQGQAVVEVYVSDKGTFTMVTSYANGLACILSVGDSWEVLKRPKGTTEM